MIRVAGVVLALLTNSAIAGSCVPLDYQEMKDMSPADLIRESCAARKAANLAFQAGVDNIGRHGSSDVQASFDQCIGQVRRIDRVLETKGVEKSSLSESCRRLDAEDAERLRKVQAK
jgi:hypothetical protein